MIIVSGEASPSVQYSTFCNEQLLLNTLCARFVFSCDCSILVAHELVEPLEHLVVPLDAVAVVEHPVVLIREDQQPAGDAALLQRMERADGLGLW